MHTTKIHKVYYIKIIKEMIVMLEEHYGFINKFIDAIQHNKNIEEVISAMQKRVEEAYKIHVWLCILKNDFIKSTTHIRKDNLVKQFYDLESKYNKFMDIHNESIQCTSY